MTARSARSLTSPTDAFLAAGSTLAATALLPARDNFSQPMLSIQWNPNILWKTGGPQGAPEGDNP